MTLLLKHRILNSRSKTDIIKTTAATDNTTQTLVSSIIRIRNINSRLIRNRLNISRTAIRRLAADLCISLSMDNTLIHNSNILNRTHHSINNISRSTDSRIINSQTLISSHSDSLMCQQKPPVDYSNTYAQPPMPNMPRKKMTPGIIVIIVVLSLLCVGSICGMIAYVASNSNGRYPPLCR